MVQTAEQIDSMSLCIKSRRRRSIDDPLYPLWSFPVNHLFPESFFPCCMNRKTHYYFATSIPYVHTHTQTYKHNSLPCTNLEDLRWHWWWRFSDCSILSRWINSKYIWLPMLKSFNFIYLLGQGIQNIIFPLSCAYYYHSYYCRTMERTTTNSHSIPLPNHYSPNINNDAWIWASLLHVVVLFIVQ